MCDMDRSLEAGTRHTQVRAARAEEKGAPQSDQKERALWGSSALSGPAASRRGWPSASPGLDAAWLSRLPLTQRELSKGNGEASKWPSCADVFFFSSVLKGYLSVTPVSEC